MNKKNGQPWSSHAAVGLAACGKSCVAQIAPDAKTDLKAAIVTDTGGADDKSFNQSAWEGLQEWVKKRSFKRSWFQFTSNQQTNSEMLTTLMLHQAAIATFGIDLPS